MFPPNSQARVFPPPANYCVVVEIIGDDLKEQSENLYVVFTPKTRDIMKDGSNYVDIVIQDDNDGNIILLRFI